jgi:hypothetical protein
VEPSNESLLNALHEAAARLSYFKNEEAGVKAAALAEWESLKSEAKKRGIYSPEHWKKYAVPA